MTLAMISYPSLTKRSSMVLAIGGVPMNKIFSFIIITGFQRSLYTQRVKAVKKSVRESVTSRMVRTRKSLIPAANADALFSCTS